MSEKLKEILRNPPPDYEALYGQSQARIAALEMALEDTLGWMNNTQTRYNAKKWRESFEFAKQALSGSKLGELFQALLEEHNYYFEQGDSCPLELKVEALLGDVRL